MFIAFVGVDTGSIAILLAVGAFAISTEADFLAITLLVAAATVKVVVLYIDTTTVTGLRCTTWAVSFALTLYTECTFLTCIATCSTVLHA